MLRTKKWRLSTFQKFLKRKGFYTYSYSTVCPFNNINIERLSIKKNYACSLEEVSFSLRNAPNLKVISISTSLDSRPNFLSNVPDNDQSLTRYEFFLPNSNAEQLLLNIHVFPF